MCVYMEMPVCACVYLCIYVYMNLYVNTCIYVCSSTDRYSLCVSNVLIQFRSNSTILVISYKELTFFFVPLYKVPEVSIADFSRSF